MKIRNNQNQFPLQLIYQQRIPKLGMYLMNKAITVSGDVSSESPCLNIDFRYHGSFLTKNQRQGVFNLNLYNIYVPFLVLFRHSLISMQ